LAKLNLSTETLQKLKQLLADKEKTTFNFLGFTLNLETNCLTDNMKAHHTQSFSERQIQLLATLLSHYSQAHMTALRCKLIKFKELPGGYAYEGAFSNRAIDPIAHFFGNNPQALIEKGKLLNSTQLSFGDASIQITSLPGIPLTYILWKAEEFSASANILYDESASNYLPTEDLAVLGELTTVRLIEAKK